MTVGSGQLKSVPSELDGVPQLMARERAAGSGAVPIGAVVDSHAANGGLEGRTGRAIGGAGSDGRVVCPPTPLNPRGRRSWVPPAGAGKGWRRPTATVFTPAVRLAEQTRPCSPFDAGGGKKKRVPAPPGPVPVVAELSIPHRPVNSNRLGCASVAELAEERRRWSGSNALMLAVDRKCCRPAGPLGERAERHGGPRRGPRAN